MKDLEKVEKELKCSLDKLREKRRFCKEHNFNIEAQFINNRIEAIEEICSEIRMINKGLRNVEELKFNYL